MTEENQRFNYDALVVRVVEQAEKVLPYFDPGSEEHDYAARLFKKLERHLHEAGKPLPEPRLERHLIEKALDNLFSLEHRIRDLEAPTDLEETFNREMQPIRDRFFDLMKQYPNLQDKLNWREFEKSKEVKVPEEWTQRLMQKIQEEVENPTVKRRH